MVLAEALLFVTAIYLGIRLGGIAIGCTGGLGVLLLSVLFGMPPGHIPTDVVLIILAIITASAALQASGGMAYVVYLTEKLIRRHPRWINVFAPFATYLTTFFTGTGHTSFAILPIIAQVAHEQKIRPSRPLSMAVIASQIAISASPLSAATIFLAVLLEPLGIEFMDILCIAVPATFFGCIPGILVAGLLGKSLLKDPVYLQRCQQGLVFPEKTSQQQPLCLQSKLGFWVFLVGIFSIVGYAFFNAALDHNGVCKTLDRSQSIVAMMLSSAYFIMLITKTPPEKLIDAPVFKAGLSACVCVLGVAWMGDTFIQHHMTDLQELARSQLHTSSWSLPVILFFASMLLYSQAATAKALFPVALAFGLPPTLLVTSMPALSALFVLPTYPTLLAAVNFDQTGSTRIGRALFNHPFFLPGIITVASSVCLSSLLAPWVLGVSS